MQQVVATAVVGGIVDAVRWVGEYFHVTEPVARLGLISSVCVAIHVAVARLCGTQRE